MAFFIEMINHLKGYAIIPWATGKPPPSGWQIFQQLQHALWIKAINYQNNNII
jgi:hypothetical protein